MEHAKYMAMKSNLHARIRYILIALTCLICLPLTAHGEDQDETLSLLGQPVEDTPVGRLPRLLSRTAENTTVVTSVEIEALNAHTLIDILATIPGIQLESQIGPANLAYTRIQGSSSRHVLVLLDGIPFNNLGDNLADIGQIPARIIERVEIVKGAASSSWGQALGGVINVITKSPETDQPVSGMVSVSQGGYGTTDTGGELSGTSGRLGYYLSGGYLNSGGLRPNTDFTASNGHGRLTWELPEQGQLGLLVNYTHHTRGDFAYTPLNYQSRDNASRLILGLSLRQPFSNGLELELDSHHSLNLFGIDASLISNKQPLQSLKDEERVSGGGARLLWRQPANLLVAGIDYQYVRMHDSETLVNADLLNRKASRWGFYLNDTYTVGPFAISPGARYDLTGTSGEQFSPSFGVTWQLTESTLLRGYSAKGFSLPSFNLDRPSERVWTSQIGLESSALPWLWLKGTLFRNETWDVSTYDYTINNYRRERQIRQGMELESRTAEWLHTSLRSGYSYVDTHRAADGSVVKDVPTNTLHLGLHYDDHRYLSALLTGRHIFWNAESYHSGRYAGLLWDLHLKTTPFDGTYKGVELFVSLRNIFNGSQYLDEAYRNNGRLAEAGVRFRF